jgi:hypothetical protein
MALARLLDVLNVSGTIGHGPGIAPEKFRRRAADSLVPRAASQPGNGLQRRSLCTRIELFQPLDRLQLNRRIVALESRSQFL